MYEMLPGDNPPVGILLCTDKGSQMVEYALSGINNHVIDDSFSIDTFVQMTEELIAKIKDKFPNNKIMIFSTSWGSILSAKLLEKNPHAVDSVVACGQIIKDVFICDEVRNTLAENNIPIKKLEIVKNVTVDNFKEKDLQLISNALRKYTNAYQNKIGKKAVEIRPYFLFCRSSI